MKSISDIVSDPGEEPEEFKKSKFWHKLFLNYKKVGLIVGAGFLGIFIIKTMFMLFGAYQDIKITVISLIVCMYNMLNLRK